MDAALDITKAYVMSKCYEINAAADAETRDAAVTAVAQAILGPHEPVLAAHAQAMREQLQATLGTVDEALATFTP